MSHTKITTVKSFVKTLPKSVGITAQIHLALAAGFEGRQLIEAGFKKNTVYAQTYRYNLLRKR